MRFTRAKFQASVLSAVVIGLTFSAGCSDDEDDVGGGGTGGGSAGTGGSTGGKNTTGGSSSGSGGKGGSAGASAGTGGSTTAGTTGTAGTAATAGTAGTTNEGGAGGEGAMGGAGGAGGAGGMSSGDGGMGGMVDPGCQMTECGASCVDLQTEEAHCGGCDRACLTDANTTGTACAVGVCNGVCATGFGDCTHPAAPAADDGCETNLTLATSCGTTCGNMRACTVDEVCDDGCQAHGIVRLLNGYTAANQNQRWAYVPAVADLSNQTITVRLHAPGVTTGTIRVWLTDNTNNTAGPEKTLNLSDLAAGWVNVEIAVGSVVGDFDPTTFKQVTMDLNSGTATSDVIVYLDSVVSSGGTYNQLFTTAATSMVKSGSVFQPSSVFSWIERLP